jgi:hypothetical protein
MTDLFDELRGIAAALRKEGIPYALIGGLACSIWVEARNTEDIDLLILPEDWPRVAASLRPLGFESLAGPMEFEKVRLRRLTKMEGEDIVVLDFVLADGDLASSLDGSVKITYRGQEYSVAAPKALIALKMNRMSPKDRNDIEGLQKIVDQRGEQ